MKKKTIFDISLESDKYEPLPDLEVSNEMFGGLFRTKPKITPDEAGVRLLKQTYLNDAWLDKQKFRTGEFKYKYSHLIKPNPDASIDECIRIFNKAFDENLKILKNREKELEPIKKLILSNPDLDPDVLENKLKNIKPVKMINPLDEVKVVSVPLANRENIKQFAEVLVKAISLEVKKSDEAYKLLEANATDWYGRDSLRSTLNNSEARTVLIKYESDLVVNESFAWDYLDKNSFGYFMETELIRPLIQFLNQSIR